MEDTTPKETFTQEKLEVTHLHIFSSPVYVHVQLEKRTKMDHHQKGAFLLDIVIPQRPIESTFHGRGR